MEETPGPMFRSGSVKSAWRLWLSRARFGEFSCCVSSYQQPRNFLATVGIGVMCPRPSQTTRCLSGGLLCDVISIAGLWTLHIDIAVRSMSLHSSAQSQYVPCLQLTDIRTRLRDKYIPAACYEVTIAVVKQWSTTRLGHPRTPSQAGHHRPVVEVDFAIRSLLSSVCPGTLTLLDAVFRASTSLPASLSLSVSDHCTWHLLGHVRRSIAGASS